MNTASDNGKTCAGCGQFFIAPDPYTNLCRGCGTALDRGIKLINTKAADSLLWEQERRRREMFEKVCVAMLEDLTRKNIEGDPVYLCKEAAEYTTIILAAADEFAKGEK